MLSLSSVAVAVRAVATATPVGVLSQVRRYALSAVSTKLETLPPLHRAAVLGEVSTLQRLLSEAHTNVNEPNGLYAKVTPLHLAVCHGDLKLALDEERSVKTGSSRDYAEAVRLLLRHQANPCVRRNINYRNPTVLHDAVRVGNKDIVEMLLANPNVKEAVNAHEFISGLPIHMAAMHGHAEIVDVLVRHGADVNSKAGVTDGLENWDIAPLHLAMKVPVAQRLVENGAIVDVGNSCGLTPLHLRAEDNHVVMMEYLLGAGANGDLPNNFGFTPLHKALEHGVKDKNAVFLLVEKVGVNVNAKTLLGQTPLWWAAMNGCEDICAYLLSRGANPSEPGANMHLDCMPASDKAIVRQDRNSPQLWMTPLHFAVARGEPRLVELLRKKGAELKETDAWGRDVVGLAKHCGTYEQVKAALE